MKYKFKVVVDTIPLLAQRTGVGRYIYEVTRQLSQSDQYELDYYYGHYSKRLLVLSRFSSLRILKWLVSKNMRLQRLARRFLMFSSSLWVPKYDLYWEPNFIPLRSIKSDKVITSVHDFSFLLYKEFHPKERIDYFEKYFFSNIYKSDMIICFSEFTKQEILERVDLPEEKIKVIYHGLDHDLFRVYTDCKTDLDLPEKFMFCVGSIEPRKNLIGLLQAFNSLDAAIKKEYHLVLAGFKGGKGIATLVGVGIALYPYEVYIVIAIFVAVLLLFKYVSLASITASVAFPFIVIFGFHQRSTALVLLAIFVGVFIPFTHRKNIKRLLNGTESKFSTKKKNPG